MSVENEHHDIRALPVGYLLSDYRIESVLGQGGFGITYLAIDTMLNRRVAIKEFFPRDCAARDNTVIVKAAGNKDDRDQFKEGLTRFLAEARVLALFDHPNIVPVRRFFEANGTAYLVMDYCEGVPLDQVISKNGALNRDQLNNILAPLLSGLETIHGANFLHRDIKPANIFIRADGSPVLLDFGAAKQDMASRSVSVTSMFTPHYGAFEQLSAKGRQGPYTDIYGLAATLYRVITGERPEDSADRILQDNLVPALTKVAGKFNERTLVAIDAGMAIRPEHRPQTVAEWRRMFGELADLPRANEVPPKQNTGEFLKTPKNNEPPKQIKPNKIEGGATTSSTKKIIAGIAGLAIVVAGALFVIYSGDQKKNQEPIKEIAAPPMATPTPLPSASVKPESVPSQPDSAKSPEGQPDSKTDPKLAALPPCVGQYSATNLWKNCKGTITFPAGGANAGDIYSGELGPKGEYLGRGIYTFANGNKYEGQFKAGLPNGKGIFINKDGHKYIGDFKNALWDGEGKLTFPNGDQYSGGFKENMFSGKGTYIFPNGEKYIGQFANDKRNGNGTLYFADGRKYVGGYLDSKFSGQGTMYGPDGKVVYAGIWKDDKPTDEPIVTPNSKKPLPGTLEQCNSNAAIAKKSLPKSIDAITTRTDTYCKMSGDRPTLVEVYEIDSANEINQVNLNIFRAQVKKSICSLPAAKELLKYNNFEYKYQYSPKNTNYKNGSLIGTLIFNQSDCP